MVHGENRIPYRIDRRLTGLAGPEFDAAISLGLLSEPEDSQYGNSRLKRSHVLSYNMVRRNVRADEEVLGFKPRGKYRNRACDRGWTADAIRGGDEPRARGALWGRHCRIRQHA